MLRRSAEPPWSFVGEGDGLATGHRADSLPVLFMLVAEDVGDRFVESTIASASRPQPFIFLTKRAVSSARMAKSARAAQGGSP